jgi:hypothetical protein
VGPEEEKDDLAFLFVNAWHAGAEAHLILNAGRRLPFEALGDQRS